MLRLLGASHLLRRRGGGGARPPRRHDALEAARPLLPPRQAWLTTATTCPTLTLLAPHPRPVLPPPRPGMPTLLLPPMLPRAARRLLGDIFPWLNVAQPTADVAAPVLSPLPLAAQPLPPQQLAAPDPAMAAMAAENTQLRAEAEANKCPICLDAAKCTVLLPCRHLALCGAPACAAILGAIPLCPLCRKPVADTTHAALCVMRLRLSRAAACMRALL